MQTFLTDTSFKTNAQHLDSKRLNKQRVECKQIYAACTGIREFADGTTLPAIGWRNHPAVRMWKGHESMLCMYALYICGECDRRGIADHAGMRSFFMDRMFRHPFVVPFWWADAELKTRIITTHRSNLLRKDTTHYGSLFPDLSPSLEYYWPC